MTNDDKTNGKNMEEYKATPVSDAGGEMGRTNADEDVRLDITVILDRSGSMDPICDDAIGSFNAFLKARKDSNPNSLMTVVLFDDEYLVREVGVPIQAVQPLNDRTYVPRGNTALFDAIGKTIRTIEERTHEDEEVMVAILTDGQENASVEYTLEQIRSLIIEKEAKDWDFVYLSADPSAFDDGKAMGFQASKMAIYKKEEMHEAYAHMDEMLAMKLSKARDIKIMKRRMRGNVEEDKMYQ